MKISGISVSAWSTGTITVTLDNNNALCINLTEDESERFRQLGAEVFTSRQKSIARKIETASPALLADFSEIPPEAPAPIDDDMPF